MREMGLFVKLFVSKSTERKRKGCSFVLLGIPPMTQSSMAPEHAEKHGIENSRVFFKSQVLAPSPQQLQALWPWFLWENLSINMECTAKYCGECLEESGMLCEPWLHALLPTSTSMETLPFLPLPLTKASCQV